ncbi:TetR family transcriptional regulator [Mycobacteroides abscessus subsp. massiliense]|nr:TetR family transcriptional regulator [Mycobacteroides abscessus subsp. massiliense]
MSLSTVVTSAALWMYAQPSASAIAAAEAEPALADISLNFDTDLETMLSRLMGSIPVIGSTITSTNAVRMRSTGTHRVTKGHNSDGTRVRSDRSSDAPAAFKASFWECA